MNAEEQNQVKIEELEEIRTEIKKNYLIGYGITAIAVILIALQLENGWTFAIIIIVSGIIITKFTVRHKESKYRCIFKIFFVKKSLESVFTDVSYNPIKGMAFDKIASTQMMNMGDKYRSEDYISARYKDIAFEQADVHIEEEHTTTDADRTSTKGVCYNI